MPLRAEKLDHQRGKIPSGVFHHLKQVGARLFDGNPIDLSHLAGCHRRHDLAIVGSKFEHASKFE